MKGWISVFVAMVLVLILSLWCIVEVPSGYTGILVTHGKVEDTCLENGRHWIWPWQKVVKMDNHVQTMIISAGVDGATTDDTAETKDQQLIPTFEFEIQYQLNAEKAYEVYAQYGVDYKTVVLKSNALQFIKEVFSHYNAEEIVTAKEEIPQQIKEKLSNVTTPLGINILRVNMVTYDFSAEYSALLEERALLTAQLQNTQLEQQNETIKAQTAYDVAVKQAEQEAKTAQIAAENEAAIDKIKADSANSLAIEQATANREKAQIIADSEAYEITTKAEAEKTARLAAAEALEAELKAQSSNLNEYMIQNAWIEKWNGKLMPNFGSDGSGFTYTDLTSLITSYFTQYLSE